MKQSFWDVLPRWVLTWLVSIALHTGLAEFLHVSCSFWLAMLVLLVFCAIFALASYFRGFWAALSVWIAGFGLCLLFSDREALYQAAVEVFSRTGEADAYGAIVLLLLSTLAAVLLGMLLRFYQARAALSVAWLLFWFVSAQFEWLMPRLIPAAMIPLLLVTAAEAIRRLRGEAEPGERLKRALVLSLLPAALLLFVLPASPQPYGYPVLHYIAEQAQKLWENTQTALFFRQEGDRVFGVSFSGISDAASLSERGEEANTGIIYVRPARTPDGALYLFGNSWDRFDGRGWSSTLGPETVRSLNWSLDTAEHIYALWRYLGAQDETAGFSDYFRSNSVSIRLQNLNVRTMFDLMDTTKIDADLVRFPYSDSPMGSIFDYVQKDEVQYRVYYLETNARLRDALISAAEGTDYDSDALGPRWSRVAKSFNRNYLLSLRDDVSMESTLSSRKALIREVYLDCSGVSERANALAAEITANCKGDYAKLSAIAAYLQENYSYTAHPDPVPAGENFLDWLLFEKKEGYCAWFATAAVLLARSAGVPARYVQGLRGELTGGVYTRLVGENAHAWCEGYIAGYGWVTVEATPGYSSGGVGWLTAAEERALYGSTAEPVPDPDLLPPPFGVGEPEEGEEVPVIPIPSGLGERPEEEAEEEANAGSARAWLAPLIIAAVLLLLAALVLFLRARRKKRYAMAPPDERLQMDLALALRGLKSRGYPRKTDESLGQYFARLPAFLIEDQAEAKEMAALYDRTFFALKTPGEDELEKHRAFAERFRPHTLRQWLNWYSLQ